MEHSESVLRKAKIRRSEIKEEYKRNLEQASCDSDRERCRDWFEQVIENEFPQHGMWTLDIQEQQDLLDYNESIKSVNVEEEIDLVSQIIELENIKNESYGK